MDPSAPLFPVDSSCFPTPQESNRAFPMASAATATRKRPAPDGTDTGGTAGRKNKQARITLGSISDYETQEAIGAGSFGVVVKARHRGTGEAVAIKCAKAPNSNNLRRILREAGCMAACRGHPSVVDIRDVVVDAATGDAFLVMELVGGGSLLRLQQRARAGDGARFSEGETRALIRQLLGGAARMHGAGIIHRDIKPGNILVGAGGALKICDLGLATPTRAEGAAAGYPERRVGTLLYLSPEQLAGRRDYGPGVDVWALGCVMDELLTGRLMFDEETEDGMVAKVTELGHALAERRLQAFDDWPAFQGAPRLSRGRARGPRRSACRPATGQAHRRGRAPASVVRRGGGGGASCGHLPQRRQSSSE